MEPTSSFVRTFDTIEDPFFGPNVFTQTEAKQIKPKRKEFQTAKGLKAQVELGTKGLAKALGGLFTVSEELGEATGASAARTHIQLAIPILTSRPRRGSSAHARRRMLMRALIAEQDVLLLNRDRESLLDVVEPPTQKDPLRAILNAGGREAREFVVDLSRRAIGNLEILRLERAQEF